MFTLAYRAQAPIQQLVCLPSMTNTASSSAAARVNRGMAEFSVRCVIPISIDTARTSARRAKGARMSAESSPMCVQRRVPFENTDSCVRAYVRREFGNNVYATCVVLAAVVTTLCIWIAVRHCCNEDHYHMILDSVQLFFFRVGWESFRILLAMMQILGCAHPQNLAHIVCDMSQAV